MGPLSTTNGSMQAMGDQASLWKGMLNQCSTREKLPEIQLIVVGDASSGKSALLSRVDESANADANAGVFGPGTLLGYSSLQVMDARAKESATEAVSEDDVVAKVDAWTLNDLTAKNLLQVALQPNKLKHTVLTIALDLSKPWTLKNVLDQWASTLEGELLQQINKVPLEESAELYAATKDHILNYTDPTLSQTDADDVDNSSHHSMDAFTKNLGVPLLLIATKSDQRPENSVQVDYIEYTLRQFALRYGAGILFTSSKTGANVDVLREYILHRAHPSQFPFSHPPQLVHRDYFFVPSGYDSTDLIHQSLVGSQPRWDQGTTFETMVPTPRTMDAGDDALSQGQASNEVTVEAHETWLEKLEKAAGAGLEDLQKQSVEASQKAEAAASARRASAERRKREETDISSKHLTNFFNNLLSRPEKSKSSRASGLFGSRSRGELRKTKSDMKDVEEELQKLATRSSNK